MASFTLSQLSNYEKSAFSCLSTVSLILKMILARLGKAGSGLTWMPLEICQCLKNLCLVVVTLVSIFVSDGHLPVSTTPGILLLQSQYVQMSLYGEMVCFKCSGPGSHITLLVIWIFYNLGLSPNIVFLRHCFQDTFE